MSEFPPSEQQENEPKVKITEYLDEYKDGVAELINDVYENEMHQHSQSGRPDLNIIPDLYQKNDGNFWVAVDEGKVIGTIGLINEGGQRSSMHRFCVEKGFRGKGLSDQLFDTLLKFAKEKGYQKLFLSTWEKAEAANKFYLKNGFTSIDSLPEDMAKRSYFSHDKVFYELDLEKKIEENK